MFYEFVLLLKNLVTNVTNVIFLQMLFHGICSLASKYENVEQTYFNIVVSLCMNIENHKDNTLINTHVHFHLLRRQNLRTRRIFNPPFFLVFSLWFKFHISFIWRSEDFVCSYSQKDLSYIQILFEKNVKNAWKMRELKETEKGKIFLIFLIMVYS